jgi:uncharacterized membrane protein
MENEKKPNHFLIVFLLLTIVGITAIDIYQDRVIEKQRYELKWLLAHSQIIPETILADAAKAAQGKPSSNGVQTQAANVAPVPSPAPAAVQPPPAAKP